MGTGPAIHIGTVYKIGTLVLVSPYKSLGEVAEDKFGMIARIFLKERFNNLEKASQIKCPTLIIHGSDDDIVPIEHSDSLQSKLI